jgi:hypothetical protein
VSTIKRKDQIQTKSKNKQSLRYLSSRRAIYKARPPTPVRLQRFRARKSNLHCTCGGDAFQQSLVYDRRLRLTHSQIGQKSKLKHSQFRQAAASFRICWSACPCRYGCTHVQVFKLITCSVGISVFVPVSPHQLEVESPTYITAHLGVPGRDS